MVDNAQVLTQAHRVAMLTNGRDPAVLVSKSQPMLINHHKPPPTYPATERLVAWIVVVLAGCVGCQAHRMIGGEYGEARQETNRACELIRSGDDYGAEQALRRALCADMSYAPAHNNLGELLFKRGEYYKASWEFEHASNLSPQSAEPLNNLALVHETIGRVDEAAVQYRAAMELAPQNPHVIGNLARTKIALGELDDELQYLLSELLLYETRPEWRRWAGERMAMLKSSGRQNGDADPQALSEGHDAVEADKNANTTSRLDLEELPLPIPLYLPDPSQ